MLIFVWEGAGGLALTFYLAGGLIGYLIGGSVGLWIGIWLAAFVTSFVGWRLNVRDVPRGYRNEHTLFFIPMQYWGLLGIFAVVGKIVALLSS